MTGTVLIQGDSLPLPRETVPYRKTWPAQLRDVVDTVHVPSLSKSEKTITDLFDEEDEVYERRELEYYSPDVLITQFGIVDCAPRYFRRWERELIRAFPVDILAQGVIHAGVRLRSRSIRRAYVPPEDYEVYLRRYLDRAKSNGCEQMVVIKILAPSEKYVERIPGIENPIQRYNDIIDIVTQEFERATTLRPLAESRSEEIDIVNDYTLEDGFHFNAAGHERLFERLSDRLDIVEERAE